MIVLLQRFFFSRFWQWQEAHLSSLLILNVLDKLVFCVPHKTWILFRFDLQCYLSLSGTPCLTELFCDLSFLTSSLAIFSSLLPQNAITEFILFNIYFWRDCDYKHFFICDMHNLYPKFWINCHWVIRVISSAVVIL